MKVIDPIVVPKYTPVNPTEIIYGGNVYHLVDSSQIMYIGCGSEN